MCAEGQPETTEADILNNLSSGAAEKAPGEVDILGDEDEGA